MDAHGTNYTLCIVEPRLEGDPDLLYEIQVDSDTVTTVIFLLIRDYMYNALKKTPFLVYTRTVPKTGME